MSELLKPVEWVGSSLEDLKEFPEEVRQGVGEDLKEFPEEVRQGVGYALYLAQCGEKHPSAKPLKGFKGAGVLEVVEDFDGDTYRAVYTLKLAGVVYVLHAFQKKSKKGIATPKQDIELIEARLKRAKEHYSENYITP
ncbi:type II toxin-antitoxin system RelE/ParE family toxin [Laspinema palackyanum]|uniref:type II toxin-antitoxin system RelE/ParE family toxin n=1 Tax=Laspinema palackyanum TaxID=3231601 RepID=UPI00345D1821|nr:type II toxin-antitoxin system RelE/ParE family toxin [Laspinema sp. D2c]